MKTFTLQEARTLLPLLRSLLQRAIDAKKEAAAAEMNMAALSRKIQFAGGLLVDVPRAARERAIHHHAVQRCNDAAGEIDAIGVQVKDLDTGLLDFPFQLDNTVVLLCWKLGEEDIAWWHPIEDGFRGRQELDERFYPKREARTPRPGGDGKPN